HHREPARPLRAARGGPMTVVDLHPEDLLDKDARGALSCDERVRLDAHLARCAACRAERMFRADFAEELDGEDRPSAILGLVQGALAAPLRADAGAEKTPDADGIPRLDAQPRQRQRPRRTA